jgi:cobaltochelatase CobT
LPGRDLSKAEVAQTRGAADAFALRLALHDDKMHAQYAPPGSSARAIFEAAEQARVESIGANAMKGVAKNLDAALSQRLKQKGYAKVRDRSEAPLAEAADYVQPKLKAIEHSGEVTGNQYVAVIPAQAESVEAWAATAGTKPKE